MSVGIDVDQHLLIVWAIAGVIAVVAGCCGRLSPAAGSGSHLSGSKCFRSSLSAGSTASPARLSAR